VAKRRRWDDALSFLIACVGGWLILHTKLSENVQNLLLIGLILLIGGVQLLRRRRRR
jgi:LPXTG-motif cell wall-anchored protein